MDNEPIPENVPSLEQEWYLPSMGKPYGAAFPEGKILVKAMTAKMRASLSDSNLAGMKRMNRIFEACLDLPNGFNVSDFIIPDQLALFMAIRVVSFGPGYTFSITCPNCNQQFRKSIDIRKLPVKYMGDDFVEPFETYLPVKKVKLGLRHIRVKDEIYIEDYISRLAQKSEIDSTEVSRIQRLAKRIVTINGEEIDEGRKLKFASDDTLVAMDEDAIYSASDENGCGVDTEVEMNCPHCGIHIRDDVPAEEDFFRSWTPRRAGFVKNKNSPDN